jgi:hypothetical protein
VSFQESDHRCHLGSKLEPPNYLTWHYTRVSSKTVISGAAPRRIGKPIVPIPRLT